MLLVGGLILGLVAGFLVATASNSAADSIRGLESSVSELQTAIAGVETGITRLQEQQVALLRDPSRRVVNQAAIVSDYYQLSLGESQSWLMSATEALEGDEALDEEALAQFQEGLDEQLSTLVATISTQPDLEDAIADPDSTVNQLLATMQERLGVVIESTDDAPLEVCLGLEMDPYAGSTLYVYLQVPSAQVDKVPETWTPLGAPKQESMLWVARCYTQAKR